MSRSIVALGLAAVALAACTPAVPDSGAGVGFGEYSTYDAQREAQLNGSAAPAAVGVMPGAQPIAAPGFSTETLGAAIDRAAGPAPTAATAPLPPVMAPGQTGAVIGAPIGALPAATDPLAATPAATSLDPALAPTTSLDPALAPATSLDPALAPMTSLDPMLQPAVPAAPAVDPLAVAPAPAPVAAVPVVPVIPVAPLPERTSSGAPNIVQFALTTSHPVGTPMYDRGSLQLSSPERACAKYGSSDLAQEAFLEAGGPEKDRKGLDPDGDGYACSWDPTPFRAALN